VCVVTLADVPGHYRVRDLVATDAAEDVAITWSQPWMAPLSATVLVRSADGYPTGPVDTAEPEDTAPPEDTDVPDMDEDEDADPVPEDETGCGCATGGGDALPLLGVGAALLVGRVRRVARVGRSRSTR
jgi:MYXO-CTERM domain-containing protein